jgi:3-methyl-2-oxobutanoate hydroxymethyltransferase
MKLTTTHLHKQNSFGKITALTAYDFPTARVADECGIDILLVGDSVGTNVLGYEDISQVTMEDMLHHVRPVARAAKRAFVLADLPFHSFETARQGLENAAKLMRENADGVKIEGGKDVVDIIRLLAHNNIPVCAHIGYTPQTKGKKPQVEGKNAAQAQELIESALEAQRAGAFMIVLELVTAQLAGEITRSLHIPTIGIGSGPLCDGQVLVIHDMIGMTGRTFRHVKTYGNAREELIRSIGAYAREVRQGIFPTESNATAMAPEVFAQVKEWIEKNVSAAIPDPIPDTPESGPAGRPPERAPLF